MFGTHFQLNEQTLEFISEIGKHMPGGFFIYKAEAPEELLYANKACFDIFGCDDLEDFKRLTGYTFKGMLHPDDYEAISNSIVEQIDTSEDNIDYVEYRIVRKDGSVRWVDDYGHYTDTDAYGGVYYVFISDITEKRERMESDKAVRQAVIEALSESYHTVWLINDVETERFSLYRGDTEGATPHGVPIRQALEQMQYSQAKDYYIRTTVAEADRERLQRDLTLKSIVANLKQKPQYNVNYLRAMDDGSERYFRIEFARVNMPGGKMGIVCGFKDVDDEIRQDQELQQTLRDAMDAANASNVAKSNFLSSMSHDMRTPMNGIIGMTAIAATHLDDRERVADCLKKIADSSSHLLALINEVLDMNKIESGKVDLQEEDFDLPELLDSVLAMIRPQVDARGHALAIHIGDIQHEKVVGDSRRVKQILVNLLSNAIKYTPDGGRITLSMTERTSTMRDIGLFEFVIEDNGIGMKPEFMQHLFEPFSRASDSATQSQQGTGLGMAITRNIVRMMGGDIHVDSTYGLGSRFTVTIYLRLQAAEAEDHTAFADLHILVADDDPVSCESACCILNDLGMTSEWALSGRAAVDRVMTRHRQGRDFFAVIVDWKMPDMSGLETTRQIRTVVGDDVPIIIISAYDWTDIESEARRAGVSAFIGKPLFKTKFVRLFQSLVESSEAEEASKPLKRLEELHFDNKRVLLAEDNPINAEIAMYALQMTGLEVDHVDNGEAALERFRMAGEGRYALIFMDIQMPRMDGYEATRAIRALDRDEARSVPIIAMTANAFEDDKQNAYNAGMNGHIAKPLNFEELSAVLQKWL